MKYLKIFEEFTEFQLDEISKEEYYSILDNNPLVYIPESKVLDFKRNLSKEYKLGYGRASVKDTVEFFRAEYETEIDYHITSKRFSIKKKSQGVDGPCYIMSYHYEAFTSFAAPQSHIETLPDQKRKSFEKKSYYRFEESDFNQMCENPQILLDYLDKNNMIKESLFSEIPDPEIMTLDEYDDEINNGKEEKFNQKEKELFIALSDTIPLQHKPYSPEFWDSQISFSLTNGGQLAPDRPKRYDGIYPELESTDVLRSITTYKNEDEFYYVSVWEREWATEDHNGTKSYRCDGYKCWEKFLKEIFQDYRDFINTKDNKVIKESFGEIPDPEPMSVNEWDEEVTNAKEVDFTQKEKELFIALSDTISVKNKRYTEVGKSNLFFQLINGDLNQRLRYTTPIRNISTYKNDDEFYYVNIWGRDDDDKVYRCDGYECWEKFLKEIFQGYRELINNQTKTNESLFDEVPEPKSLLDENGDYISGSSRASMNNREPFNKKEKSFINQLLETLNEEYISTNFSDNTEFVLNMGEMGETTHGMRVVKLTDEYYEVQYNNFVDSDDEYIYCECDGFKCLSKLLIRLFEKINKDYDYEGD